MGYGFFGRSRRRAAACAFVAVAMLPGAGWAASASGLYYERTLMHEAGDRCHLFTPSVAYALQASSLQARGAARRAGVAASTLDATAYRARTMAWSPSCASPDLTTAAQRVRDAFSGYAKLNAMQFPGDVATWSAMKSAPPPIPGKAPIIGPRWRLSEPAQGAQGAAVIGLTSEGDAPAVVTTEPGAANATYALLVVRDPAKAPEPYLDPRDSSLKGRAAPDRVSASYFAQAHAAAPVSLSPNGAAGAVMFRFPPAAVQALERLDPREAASIVLVYSDRRGERTSRILFEVGDFAAGHAFLAAR